MVVNEFDVWRRHLPGSGDLFGGEPFVFALSGRGQRGVTDDGKVEAREGHQVDLILAQVDVEGAGESEAGRNGGHHLRHQAVEVGVTRTLNVQAVAANFVSGLIVNLRTEQFFFISVNNIVLPRTSSLRH